MSPEDLDSDLMEDKIYSQLFGSGEARFCEWVYHCMEQRTLVKALCCVFKPTDTKTLALGIGLDIQNAVNETKDSRFCKILEHLNLIEPQLPPNIDNGVLKLRKVLHNFRQWGQNSVNPDVIDKELLTARRSTERLLKILLSFLVDSDLAADKILRGGGNGYKFQSIVLENGHINVGKLTLEPLNFALKAISKLHEEEKCLPLFLNFGQTVWHDKAFSAVMGIAEGANPRLHDNPSDPEESQQKVMVGIDRLCSLLDERILRLPKPVQFFRQYHDGHSYHYEGYMSDEERREIKVTFYEVRENAYELHKNYLFMSPTNPSALDAVCVPLRKEFQIPL
jgi:hypothetical protein